MRLTIIALVASLCISLLSCGDARNATSRPIITVSIEPLRYVTEQIAGDNYDVRTLTPAGASPETYQPTPQQIAALSESALYIRVGTLGFERTALRRITENAPHVIQVNASDDLHISVFAPAELKLDPHTWMSPSTMNVLAHRIGYALCDNDSANAPYYAERLFALSHHLDSVRHRLEDMLSAKPQRYFLVHHPALGHFADEFGLSQISVEQEGKAPSPAHIAALIDSCKANAVRTAFVTEGQACNATRRIAAEAGLRVVEINPLSYDWENEMMRIASALAQ